MGQNTPGDAGEDNGMIAQGGPAKAGKRPMRMSIRRMAPEARAARPNVELTGARRQAA